MTTTIITKNSSTASAVPTSGDLVQGELAVNVTDKRIFTENSGGTVVELGINPSSLTLNGGTANGVAYLNGSKVLTTGSALVFDGANLGLGVTPSAWNSSYKAFEQVGGSVWSINSQNILLSQNSYNNGTNDIYKTSNKATQYQQSNGQHFWFNAASGTAGNAISFTQAMTLDASGNLGVGSTSPDGKFVVLGTAGSNPYSHFKDASGADFFIQSVGNSDCRTGTASNHPWLMFTNGSERARIDSSGNLLVGITSASATSGFIHTNSSGSKYGWVNKGSNGSHLVASFNNVADTQVGSITANNAATFYNATSDYRLKTVIGAISGAGERIDALEPIEYEWNFDGSRTRGFLAHKFQEVYASSVTGEKDAVDENGKPIYQAMQASSAEVIADLVAEIQSLRQRVASLEA